MNATAGFFEMTNRIICLHSGLRMAFVIQRSSGKSNRT